MLCRICQVPLTVENRNPSSLKYRHRICRECNKVKCRGSYWKNHKQRILDLRQRYRKNRREYIAAVSLRRRLDPEKYRQRDHRGHLELRLMAISSYGGKCVCCGENDWHFLTIDHVENDGKFQRSTIGSGAKAMFLWLKKAGYPKDGFQLLCMNCNAAKSWFGLCPHKATQAGAA